MDWKWKGVPRDGKNIRSLYIYLEMHGTIYLLILRWHKTCSSIKVMEIYRGIK